MRIKDNKREKSAVRYRIPESEKDIALINYTGLSESRVVPVAADISKRNHQALIITATEARAKRMADDILFFAPERKVVLLKEEENFSFRYAAKSRDKLMDRLNALKLLSSDQEVTVVMPASCAIKKLMPENSFSSTVLKLVRGEEADPAEVRNMLSDMGYEYTDIIEAKGQFCVRGGIIDCFTPDSDNPYRIEFFGNEIDSVRKFDIDTQRSVENLKFAEIYPAEQLTRSGSVFEKASEKIGKAYTKAAAKASKTNRELADAIENTGDELKEYISQVENLQLLENYIHYFCDAPEHIWDYMREGVIIVDDPDRIHEQLELLENEQAEDFSVMLERGQAIAEDAASLPSAADFTDMLRSLSKKICVFTPFAKKIKGIETLDKICNVQSRQVLSFNGKMNVFESELRAYMKKGYSVTIVCRTEERLNNIREFTERLELPHDIEFRQGNLSQGIDYPVEKKVWITENEIFAAAKKSSSKSGKFKNRGNKLAAFTDIREGDYVVHENHGIGRFAGIEQLSVENEKKDYIKIKYAGNDILYVPVEQMDIVQKYVAGDEKAPKISKLSGGEWRATKAKAKAAIAVMAKDLIELYAERTLKPGHAFEKDTVWQREFEDAFPYEETGDQLRSAEEIKADMEKPFAMDRLLCGDVGFGKTEVAARAIFKCVAEGKQAAMLVPTTILANQHYYTLKERFDGFPFTVDVLSRFKKPKEQEHVVSELAKGQVDIVIGTHRLLSNDVKFKDLGLLVIDEEQRFGVEDKETIKKMKSNIDVLTLSATPIPRTLNMSLTGIKDMSLIEEAPEERYPVQTYVTEQDDILIRDVIERELGRGGQVFVVYNRVRGILQIAQKIEQLVPEARVSVGHGQMNEQELENVMLDFINGDTNVLVATTIVESGLDIPNANTMIILDADRYGLSQLYQLRGRVGRSNRMAYAYLMYTRDKVLTEVAEKRLRAIKEFTEFGAGFKVAMKDLEIRGAGNLLGTAQSGHITNVGYELYCKMVDDAVRALKGEIVNDESSEALIEIPVSAYIPSTYIESESVKLEMYKKISAVRSSDDEEEISDELTDRFGDVPKETANLIKISHIRYLAEELGISRIHKVDDGNGALGKSYSATAANETRSAAVVKRLPARPGMSKGMTGIAMMKDSRSRGPGSVYAGMAQSGAYEARTQADQPVKLVFDFAEKNRLSGFGLINLGEAMGESTFVHGGTKPFIRLSTSKKKMLTETIEMLEILYDARKGGI